LGKFIEKKTIIMKQKISYKDAGVDIEKTDQAIASSKETIQATFTKNVLSSIGGFGSMYSLKDVLKDYAEPIMVQSVDGVGTKMSVAQQCKNFSFVGADLVNACCNDVAATGAKPITFLDYIASSTLSPGVISEIIKSVAGECKRVGVSLVGGETAEMPGTYHKNEYDLVGVATGIIDKKNIIDGSRVKSGSAILGLPSSGLHTNGYSLARKLIFETLKLSTNDTLPNQNTTIEHALLAPHKNYSMVINDLVSGGQNIEGIAHITGGGLIDNVPRILPGGLAAEIDIDTWKKIPIFEFLTNNLDLSTKELYKTFNMGIGLVLIVEENQKGSIIKTLENDGCKEIGRIITSSSKEVYLREQ
jgi:phosphoribosylformylglycinamidine cyclo-ligase